MMSNTKYVHSQNGQQHQPQGYPGPQVSVGIGGSVSYNSGQGGFVNQGMSMPQAPGLQLQQPNSGPTWMEKPVVENCPPGLEYLTMVDQLIVKQQVELLEVITGFETENKYRIFNSVGQQVYFASEESGCCMRQCCGGSRGFVMHITDNNGEEVLRIVREFKCCAGCCWCAHLDSCAYVITVYDRASNVLGYVRQSKSCWKPKYTIRTPEHDVVGNINGPCCTCSCPCTGDVEFPVTSADETKEIGMISKQWSGFARELFTDADTFSVTFPLDMDVSVKATYLAALFLIDFMYFEDNDKNKNDN